MGLSCPPSPTASPTQEHIFIELMRELKHVICCYGSTRPVRKTLDDMGSQVIMQPPGNGMPFMPLTGYGAPGNPGDYCPPLGLGKEGYS